MLVVSSSAEYAYSSCAFASPLSLAGYCDINLGIRLSLPGGQEHICEVQLNLPSVLEAKHRAHTHYGIVRALLPVVCKDTGVDPGELEAFLVQRLSASSADGIVELLAGKSQGLFMHARPRHSLAPLLKLFKIACA